MFCHSLLDCSILNCISEVEMPTVNAFLTKLEVVMVRFHQQELSRVRVKLYADL